MNRRTFLAAAGRAAGLAAVVDFAAAAAGSRARAEPLPGSGAAIAEPWAARLVAAAESQIGVTVAYDPAYVRLAYPGGDVPRDRGVCTDVVVRAYRDGLATDLQRLVHEDMAAHFGAYPRKWGLKAPDSHIDHRRVPNLQTFFRRYGTALPVTRTASDYNPGDLVTMTVAATLPHIAIVSGRMADGGARPLIVHNIGAGARLEDRLFEFPLTGHYRFKPADA
jgi:uncharacterized protein YijF (DUF1287 family)